MFSATKTLGAAMVGRAAFLTRDVARSGPGPGTILPEAFSAQGLNGQFIVMHPGLELALRRQLPPASSLTSSYR